MTRDEMEVEILNALVEKDITERTDGELCEIYEILMGGDKHGHNYRVVPPTDKGK